MSQSKIFEKLDETIQEMEAMYPPDESRASYIDIQAAIETTRDACDIVIPALRASASECQPDKLQQLSEDANNKRLETLTKMRDRREQLIKKNELERAKSEWKLQEKSYKQQNDAFHGHHGREYEAVILKYRRVLQALNLTMRLQALTAKPGRCRIEFKYKSYDIIFEYDDISDHFELLEMTPKLSTFEQIKQLVQRTNDTKTALCVWRNFCKNLPDDQQTASTEHP